MGRAGPVSSGFSIQSRGALSRDHLSPGSNTSQLSELAHVFDSLQPQFSHIFSAYNYACLLSCYKEPTRSSGSMLSQNHAPH